MKEKQISEFAKDLMQVMKKHGAKIGGCGCCGSPWFELDNGKDTFDNLSVSGDSFEVGKHIYNKVTDAVELKPKEPWEIEADKEEMPF